MREYRVIAKKDMINAELKKGKAYRYWQFIEDGTMDFYCIYSKVHGAKSSSVCRIKRTSGDIFNPDRGTWIRHKRKYLVNVDGFTEWYK